jgi:hypothetical protein
MARWKDLKPGTVWRRGKSTVRVLAVDDDPDLVVVYRYEGGVVSSRRPDDVDWRSWTPVLPKPIFKKGDRVRAAYPAYAEDGRVVHQSWLDPETGETLFVLIDDPYLVWETAGWVKVADDE